MALTVAYVVLRDAPALSWRALLTLAGAVSVGLLVMTALDAAVRLVPVAEQRAATLKIVGVGIITLSPMAFGLCRWWQARSVLPGWTPAALIVFGVVAAAGLLAMPWPRRHARGRWAAGAIAASAVLTLVLLLMHHAAGTLFAVRPGTGMLHIGLFVGTWMLSCALMFGLAARYSTPDDESPSTPKEYAVGIATCFVGAGLLEADRHLLVDLYVPVHLWLGALGILVFETGARSLLGSMPPRVARVLAAPAAILVTGSALWFLFTLEGIQQVDMRSQLGRTAIGGSLLQLGLAAASPAADDIPPHPALDYDRYYDEKSSLRRPNILLISVDTLRGDALVGRGEKNARMPELQRFADESLHFRRSYAGGPRTAIGMGTLLVGRYSANIDWDLWFWRGGRLANPKEMSDEERKKYEGKAIFTTIPAFLPGDSLAMRLKSAGYNTAATPYVPGDFFRPGVGFDRGFDLFEDLTRTGWTAPTTERIVDIALDQLDQLESPWFLWIHLYDPHENKRSRARYDTMLAHTDEGFAKLRAALENRGLYDDTLIGVTSDHGEAFGEHRHRGHGTSLYEEQAHVPMILRIPGIEGRDVRQNATTIDLAATFAVAAGAPTAGLDGVNLLPLAFDNRYPDGRPVFTEAHRYTDPSGKRTYDIKAIVRGNYKLIVDRRRGTAALYDLATDPGELRDVQGQNSVTFNELSAILNSFISQAERNHPLP
jgi:choline-sulfatase